MSGGLTAAGASTRSARAEQLHELSFTTSGRWSLEPPGGAESLDDDQKGADSEGQPESAKLHVGLHAGCLSWIAACRPCIGRSRHVPRQVDESTIARPVKRFRRARGGPMKQVC